MNSHEENDVNPTFPHMGALVAWVFQVDYKHIWWYPALPYGLASYHLVAWIGPTPSALPQIQHYKGFPLLQLLWA